MRTKLVLVCVLALTALAGDFIEDNNVLVLTEENFDDAINQSTMIVVNFYAPWCGDSERLAPEYAKAATALKTLDNPVLLAKVDVSENIGLASRYGVFNYPVMKFFIHGHLVASEFADVYTQQEEVIDWVTKKITPSTVKLLNADAVWQFIAYNRVSVLFCGESDEIAEFQTFRSISLFYDEPIFAHTFDEELREEYCQTLEPHITIFKQYDDNRDDFFGGFDTEAIKQFIDASRHTEPHEFDESSAMQIFGNSRPAIIYFTDDNHETEDQAFRKAAHELKGRILISVSLMKTDEEKKLAEYAGVAECDLPAIRIVKFTDEGIKRFALERSINLQTIIVFYEDWLAGKLKPYEKEETSKEGPVKVLTTENFAKVAYDQMKDVLVEFYAPWCPHCQHLAPIYESLARRVAHNKNLIIAKVDAEENRIEGVYIQGYPTIMFWPANNKDYPQEYDGYREEEEFIKFLQEHSTTGFSAGDEVVVSALAQSSRSLMVLSYMISEIFLCYLLTPVNDKFTSQSQRGFHALYYQKNEREVVLNLIVNSWKICYKF
eukprot:TRINITY_DN5350_c0_g1_i5.p1 TRINITY_DN5350_c0_g1~~TRINITY_DN5350_c0_g1_i5.p1  ORF type:complete len:548 (+),score=143.31 TRINITY_DN5350_c0_g1_i5:116-1759(+)